MHAETGTDRKLPRGFPGEQPILGLGREWVAGRKGARWGDEAWLGGTQGRVVKGR